jgi:AcrR family transcriptional regulator
VRVDSPDNAGSAGREARADPRRAPRADALRNREALLAHATELVAEHGPGVPLDTIARSAGVGNATLYRHFADRPALLHAIAVRVVTATAQAAEAALAGEADSYAALGRYLAEGLQVRVAWVMPAIAAVIGRDDEDLAAARVRSLAAVTRLIANAQRDGAIRADLTFGDLGLLLIRLARPLPPGRNRAVQDAVAARHLTIMLAGLRPDGDPLPGTGLQLADLRSARHEPDDRTAGPPRDRP